MRACLSLRTDVYPNVRRGFSDLWSSSSAYRTGRKVWQVADYLAWIGTCRAMRTKASEVCSRGRTPNSVSGPPAVPDYGRYIAHIREQYHLSLKSYCRPRMKQELQDIGLSVGHRRVGRFMRQNNIYAFRTRKHKVTTDSNHTFKIAPNLLDQDFCADKPNQKWAGNISYSWTREGWYIWLS